MPTRWRSSMPLPARRASRSTTSGERSNTAPRWPACWHVAWRPSHSTGPWENRKGRLTDMSKHHVSTTINGEPAEFLCETQPTMLDTLRDVLGLTGSKEGCASGDCGACTIIVDGKIVCSCLMLGVEAEGTSITTIEGIAQ